MAALLAAAAVLLPLVGAEAWPEVPSALSQAAGPSDPAPGAGPPEGPVLPDTGLGGVAVFPSLCLPPAEVKCTPGSYSTGDWPLERRGPEPQAPPASPAEEPTEDVPPEPEEEPLPEALPAPPTALDGAASEAEPPSEAPAPPAGPAEPGTPAASAAPLADAAVPDPPSRVSPVLAGLAIALPWAFATKLLGILALRRRRATQWRARILALVEAHPGVRHNALVRLAGNGNGTVEHHVQALIADGRVRRVRCPGSTSYYPAGHPALARARMAALLHGGTSRRIVHALAARGGLRLGEVAKAAGVSKATAHYQLARLAAGGVVRRSGAGHEATPDGLECLRGLPERDAAPPAPPAGAEGSSEVQVQVQVQVAGPALAALRAAPA